MDIPMIDLTQEPPVLYTRKQIIFKNGYIGYFLPVPVIPEVPVPVREITHKLPIQPSSASKKSDSFSLECSVCLASFSEVSNFFYLN